MGTLATVALWVAVWQVASVAIGSQILLAGPWDTLLRLVVLVGDDTFWATVWSSFSRIALGFLLGFVLGVVLGAAASRHGWLRRLVEPALSFLKSVPIVCIIVLLLMWVGSRRVSAIAVFLAVFPAIYFSALEGMDNVDSKVSQMLDVFGVGRGRAFLAHEWPSLVPYLVATCRNVCGMAWKAGVAAEVIGSPTGTIGWRVYQSKLLLETADLFAWTLVVVLASWLTEKGFLFLLDASARPAQRLSVAGLRDGGKAFDEGRPGAIVLDAASIGHGKKVVAAGLSYELSAGQRVVLTDASGAGKTTLLCTLAGVMPALAGRTSVPHDLSMVFQEARLVEGMTAEQNVMLAGGGGVGVSCARRLLEELLPKDALGRPVSELSGGQRRRVELVRAVAHPSGAVFLDEPFSSLDQGSHEAAARFVARHLEGRTLVVASHQPEDVSLLGARALSLCELRGA